MIEIESLLKNTTEQMNKTFNYMVDELAKIRAGKANVSILEELQVSYYNTTTPLKQSASITTPDARTFLIKPWDKGMIPEIEKSILVANLGFTPQNDGQQIIINIPILTEERRKELTKQVSQVCEQGKVSVRAIRRDNNDKINKVEGISEDMIKNTEKAVQKQTDEFIRKIENIMKEKVTQIMHV